MPLPKNADSFPNHVRDFVSLLGSEKLPVEKRSYECGAHKGAQRFRFLLYGYIKAVDRVRPSPVPVTPELIRWQAVQNFRKWYALCIEPGSSMLTLTPRSESPFGQAVATALQQTLAENMKGLVVDETSKAAGQAMLGSRLIETLTTEQIYGTEEDDEPKPGK